MYDVVAVLFIAGAHVPEISLTDVVGKAGISEPEQYGILAEKVGVIG